MTIFVTVYQPLHMNNLKLTFAFLLALSFGLASCEKMDIEETETPGETEYGQKDGKPVTFRIAKVAQQEGEEAGNEMPFTNLTLLVRDQEGDVVHQIVQSEDDDDFGTLTMKLDSGTYHAIVLAHNCGKNINLTNNRKEVPMPNDTVTGSNLKVTDTFWCNRLFVVGDDNRSFELELERIVAKFRLEIHDAMPEKVKTMRFYYTGGSSTLNAEKGVGCVNSRQKVNIPVTEDMVGKATAFEVYTFPRAGSKTLKMTVSALDAKDNTLYRKEWSAVPIAANEVATYGGSFFGGSDVPEDGDVTFDIIVDDEWNDQIDESY